MAGMYALAMLAGCGRLDFSAISDGASDVSPSPEGAAHTCADIPGVLFCDGFDAPGFPGWMDVYGNAQRETAIVHGGASSFHAAATPGAPSVLEVAPYAHVESGSIHFRAWFYLPSGVAITKFNVYGTDGDAAASGVVFLDDQDELRLYDPAGNDTLTTGKSTPRDRWFCIEVHVDTAGALALDLDGQQIGAMSGVPTTPTGGFVTLGIGLPYLAPGQAPVDLYVDDMATGTLPIGCN